MPLDTTLLRWLKVEHTVISARSTTEEALRLRRTSDRSGNAEQHSPYFLLSRRLRHRLDMDAMIWTYFHRHKTSKPI